MATVRCGLIQASNDIVAPLNGADAKLIAKIKQSMLDKHVKLVKEAADKGVKILCFQEIFNGPYFCAEQNAAWYDAAEEIPEGPTIKAMCEMAKKHEMVLVVPIYEKE